MSYDDHSGLETVTWRLFDNYTGEDLVHGVEHISAQGEAQVNSWFALLVCTLID